MEKRYEIPDYRELLPEKPSAAGAGKQCRRRQAVLIRNQLSSFGIEGRMERSVPGPLVTRYEFKPAPGIKASQIASLSNELAMALRAESVRVLAPIPGKASVGIEVPAESPGTVWLRDVMDSPAFGGGDLPVALGMTPEGEPVGFDLAAAPHLLVAGQTGAGKSAAVNSMLASLLLTRTPEKLELVLIDPKMVELAPFGKVPHLAMPVVTDPSEAAKALAEVADMMDYRYSLLARAGARSIQAYNGAGEPMPFTVVVIDELSDLMMASGKEVESHIVRIAQKARAVGIHMVLTTQRPSAEVITGLIKANVPARMGFRVASNVDSRTIMDGGGCEKLLGRGDMLFRQASSPAPERIHGAYVEYPEVDAVAAAWAGQSPPARMKAPEEREGRDPLALEAKKLIRKHLNSSVSFVQRKLGVSHGRASAIVRELEEEGFLSLAAEPAAGFRSPYGTETERT